MNTLLDTESVKVYTVGIVGVVSAATFNQMVAAMVGIVTIFYILIKIVKQLRDWNRPDKE